VLHVVPASAANVTELTKEDKFNKQHHNKNSPLHTALLTGMIEVMEENWKMGNFGAGMSIYKKDFWELE
jgi:hypothetical protein